LKVAVTEAAVEAVMLQAPVPLHAPDQPANVDPAFGAAVSVIAVPAAKLALHVDPQLMPAGLLVTVPAPVPAAVTFTVAVGGVLPRDDPQPEMTIMKAAKKKRQGRIFGIDIGCQVLFSRRSGIRFDAQCHQRRCSVDQCEIVKRPIFIWVSRNCKSVRPKVRYLISLSRTGLYNPCQRGTHANHTFHQ
jgi:hypothetical protein